ncbi:ABC transporter ATP-binding protein [Irregularibacter muris]|uniref:Nickel import system ATP-binding protein NikD n=1 Tax=Irregularibacter muris TaxID=1796619 RepID=A0AAE3HI67_9FIRM|nr:ABC transporter ATP-binding protein [Irregularibacter muris]MCR1899389.1 ABC transporter ATP-binding protein [Irregularibacter muris]
MKNPLLEVKDLSISFRMYGRGLKQYHQQTISNLSIDVHKGELLAIVGSSGSGKSLLAHGIMGLLPNNATMGGKVYYEGKELTEKRLEKLRGNKIALIPQSISHLDPLMKIARQVQGTDRSTESRERQRASFERYDLCQQSEKLYPFQLSGGMARRVLISTAAQKDANLIIADEPTPGLDVEMAMKTLNYFRAFADQGKAVLMITHDIDLALQVADKIAVFYAGTIVEIAPVSDFHKGVEALRHPYTKALYKALPQNGFEVTRGCQPYDKDMPIGCAFAPRCSRADEKCHQDKSPLKQLGEGRVRCHHAF